MKALRNFSQIITLKSSYEKDGRGLEPKDISIIKDGSIVFNKKAILWVGEDKYFPDEYKKVNQKKCNKYVLLPEIVDSHTHLVFGGNRSHEYLMRINGASYEEIANNNGGINSTVKKTIALNDDELFKISSQRIEKMYSYGIGSIEIKSGYGLTIEQEYRISNIINELKKHFSNKIKIKNTYMAAHNVPSKYKNSSEYMEDVVIPCMDKLLKEGIIDAVDIFHEKGYFNEKDVIRLFNHAKNNNIDVKIHADEFNDNNGAGIAVDYNAISADHLLKTNIDNIKKLANSKTIATLLPGTGLFLGKSQANARLLLDQGAKVAIASDYNPGSSNINNLILIASIIGINYKMNIAELITAITLNSSTAMALKNQGAIMPGLKPRFSIFNTKAFENIFYNWGENLAIKPNQIID